VKLITLIFVAFGGLFLVSCSGPPTLYPIFEKGKFGYADVSGRVVITPAYEQCGEFTEGLAVVMKEGLVGFIDTNGKVVIDFQYPNAGRFSEGLAHASKDGKTGFIDKTGKVVNAVAVTEQDELMLMTSTGQSIRIRVNEVRTTGRNAQGVKLLSLKPGEKLFEELQHHTEAYAPTAHPRIMRFKSNAMFSESGVMELEQNLHDRDGNDLKRQMKVLVPEYTPFLD